MSGGYITEWDDLPTPPCPDCGTEDTRKALRLRRLDPSSVEYERVWLGEVTCLEHPEQCGTRTFQVNVGRYLDDGEKTGGAGDSRTG